MKKLFKLKKISGRNIYNVRKLSLLIIYFRADFFA